MIKKTILICLFILFFCSSSVYASDINNNKLLADNNNTIMEKNELTEETSKTFSSLQNKINSEDNNTIKLENDYEYDPVTDEKYSAGINIDKNNLVIDGQGHTINGKNSARIFQIYAENVVIKSINFINGYSTSTGGAVNFNKDGFINDCNFSNNIAQKSGGAIWFTKNGIVRGSNFNNNCALEKGGGAIFFNTGTCEMCKFDNNSATDGGAIRLIGAGAIDQCNFYNNLAKNIGGAIYTPTAKLVINNTRFKTNKAPNGTENYNQNNKKILMNNITEIGNFTEATMIIFENMQTETVDPKLDGKTGEWFYFTLKDANGAPIANTPMEIGFNGIVYTYEKDGICTDENGVAKLQINLGYKGDYTFTICYLGNQSYNASFVVANISVSCQKPTLTVPNKSYAASAKTKTLTATFKNKNGKLIIDKWISFTVNGKTYKAKTNRKGVASVNVNLTTKGTYTVVAKWAGDSTYNAVNKTAKLTIK